MLVVSESKKHKIKRATMNDVDQIHELISINSKRNVLLPRDHFAIVERLDQFLVAKDNLGIVLGCVSLDVWDSVLAEIRSLSVNDEFLNEGIGSRLIHHCLTEAQSIGIEHVFVLTTRTTLFSRFGFEFIAKENFPDKIWTDCVNCQKLPDCDEVAMIKQIS